MLFTDTFAPLWVCAPFHSWLIVWPLAYVQVTVQPVIAVVPVLLTVTSPPNAPCHWSLTRYVAVQALPGTTGDGEGDGLGEGDGDGDGDGEGDGLGEGEG